MMTQENQERKTFLRNLVQSWSFLLPSSP